MLVVIDIMHFLVCIKATRVSFGVEVRDLSFFLIRKKASGCMLRGLLIFAVISNYVDLMFYSLIFNPDENVCRPCRQNANLDSNAKLPRGL